MTSIEAMEARLDTFAAEALRRASSRLDAEHADKEARAKGMAAARTAIRAWRERATASALRSAVTARRAP